MAKFNRKFILKVETVAGDHIEIASPLTLEFSVVRHNLSSANMGSFTVYNLNEKTRNKIFKDQYDVSTFRAIQLFAGYSAEDTNSLPMVFNGNIRSAYSYRTGSNFRTDFECYDGGHSLVNGFVSKSLPAGTPQVGIIQILMDSLSNINEKVIGSTYTDQTKRGIVLFGNPAELLKQYTNGGFYIDSRNAYALDKSEVIAGDVLLINSNSGLLETPKRAEATLEVSTLFEPKLKISQLLKLESSTTKFFSGTYKVVGVSHRGVISDSIGGECRTTITLWAGNAFRPVVN